MTEKRKSTQVNVSPLAMSRRAFLPLLAAGASAPLFTGPAQSQIKIEINSGTFRPLKVAFAPMAGPPAVAKVLTEIVEGDLESSGFFQFLNPASFLDVTDLNKVPNFSLWKPLGAELLVVSEVRQLSGRLQLDFRLWDLSIGEALAGRRLSTSDDGIRRLGHILADAIYTRLTGEGPYFDSRVAFIDESGPKNRRVKRLAIMDQDGANVTYLTGGEQIALTPRFSPSKPELAFLAINQDQPSIYLFNLANGRQRPLISGTEMTFAPRYSPFGTDLIFSRQQEGNASLYVINIGSGRVQRLTEAVAIDTSPSYAPNGEQIAFESDRNGSPQIYIVNRDGSNLRRLTSGSGRYSTPVWSPRGNLIAFTRLYRGQFSIGVIKPDGSGERLLTSGFHNEGPTFSPNGRVVMFFSERGEGPRLWTVDISGRNLQQVRTPSFASDPAWSPLLT